MRRLALLLALCAGCAVPVPPPPPPDAPPPFAPQVNVGLLGQPQPPSVQLAEGLTCAAFDVPVKRSGATPTYQDVRSRLGAEEGVDAKLYLDAQGRVQHVQVVRITSEWMRDETVHTMAGWRFSPARCDGRAVTASVLVPVRFFGGLGGQHNGLRAPTRRDGADDPRASGGS